MPHTESERDGTLATCATWRMCNVCVQILSQFGARSTLGCLVFGQIESSQLMQMLQPPISPPLPPFSSLFPPSLPPLVPAGFLELHLEINNLYANFAFAFRCNKQTMNMKIFPVFCNLLVLRKVVRQLSIDGASNMTPFSPFPSLPFRAVMLLPTNC